MAKSKALNDAVDRIRTTIESEREGLGLRAGRFQDFESDGVRLRGVNVEHGLQLAKLAYLSFEQTIGLRSQLLDRMPERPDDEPRRTEGHQKSRKASV